MNTTERLRLEIKKANSKYEKAKEQQAQAVRACETAYAKVILLHERLERADDSERLGR